MSSHYITEPPPTASILLHTTAGSIQVSLFASQTPLTCRNFLQHILDGYYESTTFHRVVPGFVIQAGDPSGTGEGGESIFEDREFEVDAKTGEKVVFGDELHSRLKFNRRGLLGMAKMGGSTYGSQFFITLADVRAQLDGKCTMFGRVEGDGIYNVVRISEAENVEGTERPMYPFKITGAEVLEMPKRDPWASMRKRERVAKRIAPEEGDGRAKKKIKTKKKGKALLSFGGEEGEEDTGPTIEPKTKFNTNLIKESSTREAAATNRHTKARSERDSHRRPATVSHGELLENHSETATKPKKAGRRRSASTPHSRSPTKASGTASRSPKARRRRPSFHDATTKLPLKDPESPSRSPSSSVTTSPEPRTHKTSTSSLHAEIAALKASMRRTLPTAPEETKKKSALEQLIPKTSIRGRKRPRPGDSHNKGNDSAALNMLKSFKARLEGADRAAASPTSKERSKPKANGIKHPPRSPISGGGDGGGDVAGGKESPEAHLCDLHFIVDCQSCLKWDRPRRRRHRGRPHTTQSSSKDTRQGREEEAEGGGGEGGNQIGTTKPPNPSPSPAPNSNSDADSDSDSDSDSNWMAHALSFEKDRLGKDLTWKRKNEEELIVIDPREKARELVKDKKGMNKVR